MNIRGQRVVTFVEVPMFIKGPLCRAIFQELPYFGETRVRVHYERLPHFFHK